ncbi:MAG: multidrug transporter [Rhodanobacter sp. SCN 67-45]|nr:MAG: multidrug transporter [Rhodanobacter sp. SCN 67-45]
MKTRLLASAIAVVVLVLAVWGFVAGRKERALEAEREKPVEAASRVSRIEGLPAITLDAIGQRRAGLSVRAQTLRAYRSEVQALATVLPVSDLTALRTNLVTARAQAVAVDAAAAASAAEVRRLRLLHDQEQDVSDKALQAGVATWRADQAKAIAAQATASAAQQIAIQQWGPDLVRAATTNAPRYARLVTQRDVLLQVALAADARVLTPPATVRVQHQRDAFVTAHFVGVATRTDPRLQGASYFYVAPAAGLLPGTSLTAFLPMGDTVQGAWIPASAIVWWQGRPWVYTQHDPTHFVRHELPADQSMRDGGFVPQGFANGEAVVVTGAQLLFSEELRAQIQVGEEHE